MINDFLLRIKDVILCTAAADKYNVLLGRLVLQKIIYLFDSVNSYLYISSCHLGHQTYFFGPYDRNIQSAADALVTRGLIEAQNYKVGVNDTISCNYLITNKGREWTEAIMQSSKSIKYRSQIFDALMYSLTSRGLVQKAKELVYAEPMFMEAREHGYYYDLVFNHENSGHNYLALLEQYIKREGSQADIPFITDLYVDYLQKRCEMLTPLSHKEDE